MSTKENKNENGTSAGRVVILTLLIVILLAGCGYVGYDYMTKKDEGTSIVQVLYVNISALINSKTDSSEKKSTKEAPAVKKDVISSGVVELSNGTYVGDLKNGKPHGHGKLTYSKKVLLNPDADDNKQQYTIPGDYFVGEWHNGNLNFGKLYHSNNVLVRSLNLGIAQ